jgi:hypothetical protein
MIVSPSPLESTDFFWGEGVVEFELMALFLEPYPQALNMNHFVFFFFGGTGALAQGLHLESLYHSYFCEGFFKIGSRKLFFSLGFL